LEKARELLKVQAGIGGFYNSNSAELSLSEVAGERGRAGAEQLVRGLGPEKVFGFQPGTRFEEGPAKKP
jgi:hypothetical protein